MVIWKVVKMKLVCTCGKEMEENGGLVKKSITQTLFKCVCGNTGLVLNYPGTENEPDFYIKDTKGKLLRHGQISQ
jgi:hypothetical protein